MNRSQDIKIFVSFVSIIIFAAMLPLTLAADVSCRPVRVLPEVELPGRELVLADILAPNTCSTILSAARHVPLGNVPLYGSPRVLTADEIRGELQKLREAERLTAEFTTVPERVIVRRKHDDASIREARLGVRPHAPAASASGAMIRPGQSVVLVWDEDGIRVQVPALSLDAGGLGAQVRARILRGNRVVRAIVESAESVRAIS